MPYTTLRVLRQHDACTKGYERLRKSLPPHFGQDEAIPLAHILCSNGPQDTLWALSAVHPDCGVDRDRIARLAACDFAEAALPFFEREHPNDSRPREAINVARRFSRGEASSDELAAARDAAWAAAWDAQSKILFRYLTRGE
ncbi:putative immunity protein [Solidesulfovibrio sp.]